MIIKDIHASLLKFCSDYASNHEGMTVVNFDAHADDTTLPANDVIGLAGLSVTAADRFLSIKALIGISTLNDTNLFRLAEKIAELFERLMPESRIDVVDAATGEVKGWMIAMDGTTMLASEGTKARPLQHVAVSLGAAQDFRS
ncbi:MAG TPA: hypothetical protein VEC99_05735 [Clostridia bacterium]|nr:hypothetical protein [Clostridia bacterium]